MNTQNDFIGYATIAVIAFIAGVFITRWIFRVDIMVAYQKKQYFILRQLAHKLGVTEESIAEIDEEK